MEENLQTLKKRRNFLIHLKNRIKYKKVKRVLHETDVFNNPESSDSETVPMQPLKGHNSSPSTCVNERKFNFLRCNEVLLPSDAEINFNARHETENDPFANSDDSKEDPDYTPEIDENHNNSLTNICEKPAKKIVILQNTLIYPKTYNSVKKCNKKTYCEIKNQCEYIYCRGEVFSTCHKCLCYLCWEHFNDEFCYTNCTNHKSSIATNKTHNLELTSNQSNSEHCEYLTCYQNAQSCCEKCLSLLCLDHFYTQSEECANHKRYLEKDLISNCTSSGKVKETLKDEKRTQHCEHIDCTKNIFSTCTVCFCFLCIDHYMCTGSDIAICKQHQPFTTDTIGDGPVLTKDGTLRKRKLYDENLESRIKKKTQRHHTKFRIRQPCGPSCRKRCTSKINNNMRQCIHEKYHNLNWEGQGLFIKGLVDTKPVEKRKQNTKSKRNVTLVYNFPSEHSAKTEVCKTFFLSTLGYDPKNDTRVLNAVYKEIDQQKNLKGSYKREHVIDRNAVTAHISKYEPLISHHRRKHAPNRLYLPSDLNVNIMFKDFCNTHPSIQISCESYRKILRNDLNISFSHLGNEECEECVRFKLHDCKINDCDSCSNYNVHKSKYTTCRKAYQEDVQTAINSPNGDTLFYSVDLQKVIQLPRMEQYKSAIFCSRIIAYNETFVPLGPSTASNVPFAVVWHEALAGRNQEEIISAFRAFFLHNRDLKHFVLWMDNCSAQNKNWALFSFLVDIINSQMIAAETICFKYLEPGHTFMSADSFHHQVELSMLRKKKVYDFDDFVDAVRESNSKKNFVKVMKVEDFYYYADLSSQVRLRKREPRCYLRHIMWIKAQRGCLDLKFKFGHEEEIEQSLDFLMSKIIKSGFPEKKKQTSPCGISKSRKDEIIKKLLPLMPETRKTFWYSLPESE